MRMRPRLVFHPDSHGLLSCGGQCFVFSCMYFFFERSSRLIRIVCLFPVVGFSYFPSP